MPWPVVILYLCCPGRRMKGRYDIGASGGRTGMEFLLGIGNGLDKLLYRGGMLADFVSVLPTISSCSSATTLYSGRSSRSTGAASDNQSRRLSPWRERKWPVTFLTIFRFDSGGDVQTSGDNYRAPPSRASESDGSVVGPLLSNLELSLVTTSFIYFTTLSWRTRSTISGTIWTWTWVRI